MGTLVLRKVESKPDAWMGLRACSSAVKPDLSPLQKAAPTPLVASTSLLLIAPTQWSPSWHWAGNDPVIHVKVLFPLSLQAAGVASCPGLCIPCQQLTGSATVGHSPLCLPQCLMGANRYRLVRMSSLGAPQSRARFTTLPATPVCTSQAS